MKKLFHRKRSVNLLLLLFLFLQYGCNSDNDHVNLESFTLDTSEMVLSVNEILPVVVLPTPDNATEKILWESSNPEIAQVQSNKLGLVSGIMGMKEGSAIITASSQDGSIKQTIAIQVKENVKVYCTIAGSGDYCPEEISTQNAEQNIKHSDSVIPSENYKYYEEDRLIVKRGSSFVLDLVQSNNWSCSAIWIDWNGNTSFADNQERVAVFGRYEEINDGPFSKTINVPEDASLEVVRMRIITSDSWAVDLQNFEPCGYLKNSTIKDFDIEIID